MVFVPLDWAPALKSLRLWPRSDIQYSTWAGTDVAVWHTHNVFLYAFLSLWLPVFFLSYLWRLHLTFTWIFCKLITNNEMRIFFSWVPGFFVHSCHNFVLLYKDSAISRVYAKHRAVRLGIDKACLDMRKLDPTGVQVARAKCLHNRKDFFKGQSFIWHFPITSIYLSLSLHSLYLWDCRSGLWRQRRSR